MKGAVLAANNLSKWDSKDLVLLCGGLGGKKGPKELRGPFHSCISSEAHIVEGVPWTAMFGAKFYLHWKFVSGYMV